MPTPRNMRGIYKLPLRLCIRQQIISVSSRPISNIIRISINEQYRRGYKIIIRSTIMQPNPIEHITIRIKITKIGTKDINAQNI